MSFGKKDICNNISSKAQISQDKSKELFKIFISLVTTKSRIVKISKFG
jgi:nucleoid DNA-binding protein